MGKTLTFTNLIKSDVVSRNDAVGNISSLKRVISHEGAKVFFSDKTYKRAIWNTATAGLASWKKPEVSAVGGVVQKISTVIDSEELDFSGTMVAKPFPYSRESVFVTTYGVSLNEYVHCLEFLTNMGLAKSLGIGRNAIYNREFFQGVYKISGLVDLDRVGIQEIILPDKIEVPSLEMDESMDVAEVFEAMHKAIAGQVDKVGIEENDFVAEMSKVFSKAEIVAEDKVFRVTFSLIDEITESDENDGENETKGSTWQAERPTRKLRNLPRESVKRKSVFADIMAEPLIKEDIEQETVRKIRDLLKKAVKSVERDGDQIRVQFNKSIGDQKPRKAPEYDDASNLHNKLRWVCSIFKEYLGFSMRPEDFAMKFEARFADGGELSISKEQGKYRIKIELSPKERARRVIELIDQIMELKRTMEGRYVHLAPFFSVWSTELSAPVFHDMIEDATCIGVPKDRVRNAEQIGPGGSFKALYNGGAIYYGRFGQDFLDKLKSEIETYYGVPPIQSEPEKESDAHDQN